METQLQAPYLPPEILEEIFLRLPIKSIIQFQLLSKFWRSIFSSHYFWKKYHELRVAQGPTSLVIAPNDDGCGSLISAAFVDLDDHDNLYDVIANYNFPSQQPDYPCTYPRLLGSWNGLVALYDGVGQFVLWNPCTDEQVVVNTEVRLHHDVTSSQFLLGLCYDAAKNEYTGVVFNCYIDPPQLPRWYRYNGAHEECEIAYLINFSTGSWEELTVSSPIARMSFDEQVGVIIDGVPHWLETCHLKKVWYFDHVHKDVKQMCYPSIEGKEICGIGALHGKLTATFRYPIKGCSDQQEYEIWAMQSYGVQESWVKLFVMPQEIGFNSYDSLAILGFNRDGEIVVDINGNIIMDQVFHKAYYNNLMVYNPRENKLKKIVASRFGEGYSKTTYIPTSVSPY